MAASARSNPAVSLGGHAVFPAKSLVWIAAALALLGLTGCGSKLEGSVIVHPNGTWKGEARLSALPSWQSGSGLTLMEADVQRQAAALLDRRGIRHTLKAAPDGQSDDYALSLEGKNLQALAEMAFDDKSMPMLLDGPIALQVQGPVREGQVLELTLPANPSTGYSWQVETREGLVSQLGSVETRQVSKGLGRPARQVIRFKSRGAGLAEIRLTYRRSWESVMPSRVLSIQSADKDLSEVLAALSAPPVSAPADKLTTGEPSQGNAGPISAQTLPSAWSWCAQGGCTPIRDQKACGSCWAFATVGPLELNLKIQQGLDTDLSEQYLVSCDTEESGCNGGWFAHDWHLYTFNPPETQAGAVLESAFPYQANDPPAVPCKGPYSHPHRIQSWAYVGNDSSIPSVNAIKQAIYAYGPVAAAICASGPLFNGYRSGVYQTDEKGYCYGGTNHAIVLVGWDDSQGAWILRNSWGTGWGESGYMRIKYGVSNVGYAANYIVYPKPLVATHWAYLPMASKSWGTTYGLRNGDFESGRDGSWSESSSNGWALILSGSQLPPGVTPHGGGWAAWLGGDDNETSILSQQVTIPSDATTLNYWYWSASQDYCGYDYAYVRFGSTNLTTYNLCSANNTGGWVYQQIDVTSWRGQTVDVRFVVTTDSSLNSNFFLDDVSLSVTLASAPPATFPPGAPSDASAPKSSVSQSGR